MNTLDNYYALLRRKKRSAKHAGISDIPPLNGNLFGYQEHCVEYLLNAGSGAAFLDTGMGKSFVSIEWGRVMMEHHNKSVLMLAPLAVGQQHERESEKFGLDAKYIRDPAEMKGVRIYITNYERRHLFDFSEFCAIILDESSIIKNYTGATSRDLIESASRVKYRLACTATPAPNDHMELGQHSAFVGAMSSNEMLSRWFVADQSEMGRYRLKKHGEKDFWRWMASWSRMATHPSDLGYSDDGFILPPLKTQIHSVAVDMSEGANDGELFRLVESSATSIHKEKRIVSGDRARVVADIVDTKKDEPWVVWCDTDYDADSLIEEIPTAIEVRGSYSPDKKEELLNSFSNGESRILITKPSVAGFGLNWQHCANVCFAGVSFSYENYYQAVRRTWRFGQKKQVNVHIALADTEYPIWNIVQRKANDHARMKESMSSAMRDVVLNSSTHHNYLPTQEMTLPEWLK